MELRVYYTRNKYTLTINYVYEDGSKASDSYVETLEYNKQYSVNSPEILGYAATNKVVEGKIGAEDTVITVTYKVRTETPYKVEHYKQNIENEQYTIVSEDTENLIGTTGTETEAKAKVYEGFTVQEIDQVEIQGDGSTVVKVYYTRNTYEVVYKVDGKQDGEKEYYKYGASIIIREEPTKEGYKFKGWYIDETLETEVQLTEGKYIVLENITLYAEWEEIQLKTTSEKYQIDQEKLKIKGIQTKTTVEKLKETLESNISFEIQDSKGKIVEDTAIIGTGYKVKLENGISYTIIVTGDLNGDGQVKPSDLSKLKLNLVGRQILQGEYAEAADLNGDGNGEKND